MNIGFFGNKKNVGVPQFSDPPHEEFWAGFREYIEEQNSSLIHFGSLKLPFKKLYDKVGESSYSGCDLGIEKFGEVNFRDLFLVGIINPENGYLSIKLQIGKKSQSLFEDLKINSNSIESNFTIEFNSVIRCRFEWLEKSTFFSIGLFGEGMNIEDKSCWTDLYEWIRKILTLMEMVFMNQLALYYYRDSLNKT